jgi:hypothetical protein
MTPGRRSCRALCRPAHATAAIRSCTSSLRVIPLPPKPDKIPPCHTIVRGRRHDAAPCIELVATWMTGVPYSRSPAVGQRPRAANRCGIGCAARYASRSGRNVLVHAEEILGIQLGFHCRQARIVGPVGCAHSLRVFPCTEGVHVHCATGPGGDRLPTIPRPLHMPRVFCGLSPLSQNQDVEVRFPVSKSRRVSRNTTDRAAIVTNGVSLLHTRQSG